MRGVRRSTSQKNRPRNYQAPIPVKDMDKKQLLQTMGWEHPRANLDVGTLNGNVEAVLKDEVAVTDELIGCLRKASREA